MVLLPQLEKERGRKHRGRILQRAAREFNCCLLIAGDQSQRNAHQARAGLRRLRIGFGFFFRSFLGGFCGRGVGLFGEHLFHQLL